MSLDIAAVIALLQELIALEKRIEEMIESEQRKGRRKKLEKAVKDRDVAALRRLILGRSAL